MAERQQVVHAADRGDLAFAPELLLRGRAAIRHLIEHRAVGHEGGAAASVQGAQHVGRTVARLAAALQDAAGASDATVVGVSANSDGSSTVIVRLRHRVPV